MPITLKVVQNGSLKKQSEGSYRYNCEPGVRTTLRIHGRIQRCVIYTVWKVSGISFYMTDTDVSVLHVMAGGLAH